MQKSLMSVRQTLKNQTAQLNEQAMRRAAKSSNKAAVIEVTMKPCCLYFEENGPIRVVHPRHFSFHSCCPCLDCACTSSKYKMEMSLFIQEYEQISARLNRALGEVRMFSSLAVIFKAKR